MQWGLPGSARRSKDTTKRNSMAQYGRPSVAQYGPVWPNAAQCGPSHNNSIQTLSSPLRLKIEA